MLKPSARLLAFAAAAFLGGCGGSTHPDKVGPPAAITAVGAVSPGVVGTTLTTPLSFKITDASGRLVSGVSVGFTVTAGNGTVNPGSAVTGDDGVASTHLTLGTTAGRTEVTASVNLVAAAGRISVDGTPDVPASVALSTRSLRLAIGTDTARLSAGLLDRFGNTTGDAPTWTSRDASLVSISTSGLVTVLRRGGATYVVASSGAAIDSTLVTVLSSSDSPCTGVASPVTLAVGQVIDAPADLCIQAGVAGEEYVMMPYLASNVPTSVTQLQLTGTGLGVAPVGDLVSASRVAASPSVGMLRAPMPDDAFETMIRQRGREAMATHASAARSWYRARHATVGLSLSTAAAPPNVGDIIGLNTSLVACGTPAIRFGRVAAVTQKTIIVADTTNPAGGFTDAEYTSFGVTFDTLIDAVDVAAFGAPSDIDGNGRIVVFFTRAVNQMTPAHSTSVTLGFFYSRDLLPTTGTTNPCAGSNFAEMFYLIVPDSTGVVNTNVRTKQFVLNNTPGTLAHEYQHLINSARRLYVNAGAAPDEEAWLNEGLSHIAEELLFYHASGMVTRLNIGTAVFADPKFAAAWQTYMQQNYLRYRVYLPLTETTSPFGGTDLSNRGAVWSFLRYAADRTLTADGDVWFRLVNSTTTGFDNLAQVFTPNDPQALLRDWAMSVYLDDKVSPLAAAYRQASWNTRAEAQALGQSFPVTTTGLSDAIASTVTLSGGGVSFRRFAIAAGQAALLSTRAFDGSAAPVAVKVSVARTR